MYILLIILFIVFISILYYLNVRNEGFNYSVPTTVPKIINSIKSNKNIFINNNESLDINTINVRNICIKDNDGTECISKEQLFNTLNLPIFRKHSICIEDACISKNNLKKILGENEINLKTPDDKCFGLDKIPGTLSIRQQARWETDRKGIRDGDLGARKYHSLYEPKDGWVRETNCGVKNRKKIDGTRKGYRYDDYDYGRKFNEREDAILNYGCARKHSRSPGVCWASAGGKCKRDRNNRRRISNAFYKNKLYNLEGGDDDVIDNISSLKQGLNCSDENTKYKVESGGVIGKFKNILNPLKAMSYKQGAVHGVDHNRVIQ